MDSSAIVPVSGWRRTGGQELVFIDALNPGRGTTGITGAQVPVWGIKAVPEAVMKMAVEGATEANNFPPYIST